MPLIKPRAQRVKYVRHAYRLSVPMRDVLMEYALFIDESPDYVLNAVIEATLAKDRDFLVWRAEVDGQAGTQANCGRTASSVTAAEPPSK